MLSRAYICVLNRMNGVIKCKKHRGMCLYITKGGGG